MFGEKFPMQEMAVWISEKIAIGDESPQIELVYA